MATWRRKRRKQVHKKLSEKSSLCQSLSLAPSHQYYFQITRFSDIEREGGLKTFPIIKYCDVNSSAVVVTFLPILVSSWQHLKNTRDEIFPFVQHGGHKIKLPKEIESIFAYSSNELKKIDGEIRRRRREIAYSNWTGYHPSHEDFFLCPTKRLDRFSKAKLDQILLRKEEQAKRQCQWERGEY